MVEDPTVYTLVRGIYPKLSEESCQLLLKWQEKLKEVNRPNWTETMLSIAFEMAKKSPDAQSQYGAVICNEHNEIISTGYNGHMRDIDDRFLPNLRPEKYDWMIHAEHNAILSCARQGKSTLGATVYVTGLPCLQCFEYMWQCGIRKIVYAGGNVSAMQSNKDSELKTEIFRWLTASRLEVEEYKFENPEK